MDKAYLIELLVWAVMVLLIGLIVDFLMSHLGD